MGRPTKGKKERWSARRGAYAPLNAAKSSSRGLPAFTHYCGFGFGLSSNYTDETVAD